MSSETVPSKKRSRKSTSSNQAKSAESSESSENVSGSSIAQSKNNISITDIGAIKVSRIRKSSKESKKPRIKRFKPNPGQSTDSLVNTSIEETNNRDDDEEMQDEECIDIGLSGVAVDENAIIPLNNRQPHVGKLYTQFITTIFDEIALEGLDGITLEALCTRLAICWSIVRPISRNLINFIWDSVKPYDSIEFYELEVPRRKLILNSEHGVDIYPFEAVKNEHKNIMGSCSTYRTRRAIEVRDMSLIDAEVLGNSLVLVASQELRNNALVTHFADPRIMDTNNVLIQPLYYILERIGRSRRQGELTTGPNSLSEVVNDPKTLFYYRNQLQQMKLVAKQSFHMRYGNTTSTGGLIHLDRFFNEVKSQRQIIIEYIVSLIKDKPKYRMEYMELRRIFGRLIWEKYQLTKVIKSLEFRQFVKTDVALPYRSLYPGAAPTEWKQKAKEKEKIIKVFELRNPNLNINSMFREDKVDDDGIASSDSDLESESISGEMVLKRIYDAIYEGGIKGLTMRKIATRADVDYYTARNLSKVLLKRGDITQTMCDAKRQHFMLYIAAEFKKEVGGKPITDIPIKAEHEEVHDETYAFLADLLKVDESDLKDATESESEDDSRCELTENIHTTIKVLRKVKDTQNLATYFSNQHLFNVVELRPLKVLESNTNNVSGTNVKQFFSTILGKANQDEKSSLPFVPWCKFDITSTYNDVPIRQKITHPVKRVLKSFKPFTCLLDSSYEVKDIDYYLKDKPTDILHTLSSSDDEAMEEFNSVQSVASSICGSHQAPKDEVPEDVRDAIIEHFEANDVPLRDKLNAQHVGNVANVVNSVALVEDNLSQETFYNAFMEMYMGPKPRILSVAKDTQEVETMIVMSTRPEDFTVVRPLISDSQRVQTRVKIIRDAVCNQKCVIDLNKIQGIIYQAEAAEGYNARVDRKSLHRILTKMIKNGEFCVVKIIVKFRNIVRTKNVITEAKSDVELLIQSIVDQFKNSFVMYAKRKLFEEEERKCEVPNKVRRRFKYNRFIGRTYGTCPKVTKMRIMHEFMFYLMRGYTGAPIARDVAHSVFQQHCDSESIDSIMSEATTLYSRTGTWRMFVPPLPEHRNWPNGWAMISDIFLRMPLSLFVKVYNVTYVIPELPSYLNHPVRKHFIVKNMPPHIKDALFGYRKYIFAIHEIICLLAYMGLVQFGPQKMREKDQVFIYLNNKAIIFDTTSSERGYHHVTAKEYPMLEYNFQTAADVEQYWADMYYHSVNTKLGNRSAVIGQSIKLEFVHAKPLLSAALKPQTVESALRNDIGYLPGDRLGACCSDSSIWLHVQKNWYGYSRAPKRYLSNLHPVVGLRRQHLEEVKSVKVSEMHPRRHKKMTRVASHRTTANSTARSRDVVMKKQARSRKTKVILRKVKPRKIMRKNRIRVDMIDKIILDKMGKSRAIFKDEEDDLIMVCMECNEYLTAFNKKRTIGNTIIRDFIHRTLPQYTKKTSLAYKRRSVQLRKRNNLDDQKEGINFNMLSDFYTEKYFGNIRNDLKRNSARVISESHLTISFLYLANYMWKQFRANPSGDRNIDNIALKDYLRPGAVNRYKLHLKNEDTFCKDPTNEDEINLDTIQSLIHCSFGAKGNDPQWLFQLLKVYQTFSEELLRAALVNMRDYQIISGKKVKSGREGTILMSGVSYNLSFNYTFKQITLFPHCIFTEAHEILMAMILRFDHFKTTGLSFEKFEHGHGLGLGEFQVLRNLNWVFDLPEDIISLNPKMSDFSELIKELSQRYTELMKKSQDTDDGSYDPDTIKQLESTLLSYIQEQEPEVGKDDANGAMLTNDQTNPKSIESSAEENSSGVTTESVAVKAEMHCEATPENLVGKGQELTTPVSFPPGISSNGSIDGNTEFTSTKPQTAKIADFGNYGKADRRHKSWRISDMAFMLTKGLFPELDDDERLEKLNEHFIVRYPTCRIRFDEMLTRDDAIFRNWHEGIKDVSDDILRNVLSDAIIQNIPMDQQSFSLKPVYEELANFIYSKNFIGATSPEIKKTFVGIDVEILDYLISIGLVLRLGVCNFYFVHHNYRHCWTISLVTDNTTNDTECSGQRLKISPWIRINGTVDESVLDKWLSIILSYCLSFPCITFSRLSARFNIIKPVDIYYLLEILQRLECLRIWCYVHDDTLYDIFDSDIVPQVPGSTLDDLDDVFVETESAVITKFGAFLNRRKTDFAYAFEEDD